MKLGALLKNIATVDEATAAVDIDHITTDAALCTPKSLYVAIKSESSDMTQPWKYIDGRKRIALAIKNGAKVIFSSPEVIVNDNNITLIKHPNPNAALGDLAASLYEHQAPGFITAVTGTNGKSSTVMFAYQLWHLLGAKGASIGNLGVYVERDKKLHDLIVPFSVPETVDLHAKMHELKSMQIDYVAMEATSHSLHDYRLNGLKINCAVFTNLTHDHLDFHQTMENYFQAKLRLFDELINQHGTAIINSDNEYSQRVIECCQRRNVKTIDYGYKASDFKLLNVTPTGDNQTVNYRLFDKEVEVNLSLIGEYQALNILAAMAIVYSSGFKLEEIIDVLPQLRPIPGRLEMIMRHPQTNSPIYCDYAHTEDGFRQLLSTLRSTHDGKLIVVFGCDGERDISKRPVMGKLVHELADIAIVSDGFYRSEAPAAIRQQIINDLPMHNIGGRENAVAFGLNQLKSQDDCLVICGIGEQIGPEGLTDSEMVKKLLKDSV